MARFDDGDPWLILDGEDLVEHGDNPEEEPVTIGTLCRTVGGWFLFGSFYNDDKPSRAFENVLAVGHTKSSCITAYVATLNG